MSRPKTALILIATVVACGGSPLFGDGTRSDSAQLMAAALTHLISDQYGGGSSFSQYLIETNSSVDGDDPRPLTDDERAAVEEAIFRFGPARWISDPEEWRTPNLTPRIEGSVIPSVGVPTFDEDRALVSVSTWCGSLCGMSLTYRIQEVGDEWHVTGIEGPIGTA